MDPGLPYASDRNGYAVRPTLDCVAGFQSALAVGSGPTALGS